MSDEQTKELAVAEKFTASDLLNDVANRHMVDAKSMWNLIKTQVLKGKDGREPTTLECQYFLTVCREYGLNPMIKQIYGFQTKSGQIEPVISVDGWLHLIRNHTNFKGLAVGVEWADSHGNGRRVPVFGWVEFWTKDGVFTRENPFRWEEDFVECRRDTGPWKSHPSRMIKHKALIQGARYLFGFSGIYDHDEGEAIVDAVDARFEEVATVDMGKASVTPEPAYSRHAADPPTMSHRRLFRPVRFRSVSYISQTDEEIGKVIDPVPASFASVDDETYKATAVDDVPTAVDDVPTAETVKKTTRRATKKANVRRMAMLAEVRVAASALSFAAIKVFGTTISTDADGLIGYWTDGQADELDKISDADFEGLVQRVRSAVAREDGGAAFHPNVVMELQAKEKARAVPDPDPNQRQHPLMTEDDRRSFWATIHGVALKIGQKRAFAKVPMSASDATPERQKLDEAKRQKAMGDATNTLFVHWTGTEPLDGNMAKVDDSTLKSAFAACRDAHMDEFGTPAEM